MIICVEDDDNIRELEIYTLRSVGYESQGVASGAELYKLRRHVQARLIILDVMLPDESGLEILQKLRGSAEYRELAVIMATAKGSEFDKVQGLDSGADDYLAKPFGMMELVSRVKAVLRRTGVKNLAGGGMVRYGCLELDTDKFKIWVQGEEVLLTLKEFEVLHKLIEHPGRVYTRDSLLEDIWGYGYTGETRTVDVHIRTLRQKLGAAGDYVETVRGVGYRLKELDEG